MGCLHCPFMGPKAGTVGTLWAHCTHCGCTASTLETPWVYCRHTVGTLSTLCVYCRHIWQAYWGYCRHTAGILLHIGHTVGILRVHWADCSHIRAYWKKAFEPQYSNVPVGIPCGSLTNKMSLILYLQYTTTLLLMHMQNNCNY